MAQAVTPGRIEDEGGGSRLSAAALIGPATIIVAGGIIIPMVILFR
jgi:hypothetical protein